MVDVADSAALPAPAKSRLAMLAGRRLNREGVLVIFAQRHRTQEANRREANQRLAFLIVDCLRPPKPRVATRPTRASRERRLQAKKARSAVKQTRRVSGAGD